MIINVKGDVIKEIAGNKNKILIPNIVNDINKWGSGFVVSISDKWKSTKSDYNKFCNQNTELLGKVQFLKVEPNIIIANMFAQEGIYWKDGIPPIRYKALQDAMVTIEQTVPKDFEIHSPYIGMGRAGGNREVILNMIDVIWKDYKVFLYKYGNDTDLQTKLHERNPNYNKLG